MRNSVLSYLEESAIIFGDKVAVSDADREITFSELRHDALCIAEEIYKRNIGSKMPVFVYLPKGIISITAFMGVLYSGCFYTPTDVKFPFGKVKGILDCLNPAMILTNSKYGKFLIEHGIDKEKLLMIEAVDFTCDNAGNTSMMEQIIDTDIAYVLFTSGSTGVPKGVAVAHRSIMDYIDWVSECYEVDESMIIGNQAPFYFDNSTLDIYLPLCTGASLQIIPEINFAFPAKLMQYIVDKRINMIFWVPSVMIQVANCDILSRMDLSCLKRILFAGEIMPNKQLNYWRKHIPDAIYSNLYGPTEITVDCTYYIVDREFGDMEPLPIGKPCKNCDVIILTDEGEIITEPGVTGELCVRGTSLAAGYWNNQEKTDEYFIQNPLNTNYPEKIYKTGDLVYYNDLGELMFAGRIDSQIKFMGYRIELGEIESAVLGIKEINNACVLFDEIKKQIVLFYETNIEISESDIRKQLLLVIPKYMIPTEYMQMKRLPYNDNGKIDRQKLKNELLRR